MFDVSVSCDTFGQVWAEESVVIRDSYVAAVRRMQKMNLIMYHYEGENYDLQVESLNKEWLYYWLLKWGCYAH
jgi:hypothetical protein